MNCARLIKKSTFQGSEAEQVNECLALINYMIKETSNTIEQLKEKGKKAGSNQQPATPAPTVKAADLKPHMPE